MPQKDCNRTFIPDLLAALERQGEPVLEATLKEWLLSLSPAPFGFPFCLCPNPWILLLVESPELARRGFSSRPEVWWHGQRLVR